VKPPSRVTAPGDPQASAVAPGTAVAAEKAATAGSAVAADAAAAAWRGNARAPLRSRQRGGIGRALLWTAAALLVLAALILAALTWGPNLMRDRIAAEAGERLGRAISIGRIEVSPFAGRVVISDLTVEGSEAGKPALTVKRIAADVDPWAWARRVTVVETLEIDDPVVRVVRIGPDRFDFSEVVDRLSGGPPPARQTIWRLDRLVVVRGSVRFDDRVVQKVSRIDGLELALVDLSRQEDHVDRLAKLQTRFTLNDRPVALDGSATPFATPRAAAATLRLDGLPVSDLLPYVPLPPDVRPTAGTLEIALDAKFREGSDAAGPLRIEGRMSLDGPRIQDAEGRERLAAGRLALTLAPSSPLGGTVHASAVTIEALTLALGRNADGSLEWPAARTAPGAAATEGRAPPGATRLGPKTLRIDALKTEARVAWRDAAVAAPLALQLDPVRLDGRALVIADLGQPDSIEGNLRLDTTIDGSASLGADVTLEGRRGRAQLDLKGIEVARYASLAGPALKASVEQGRFGARATIDWDGTGPAWSVSNGDALLEDLRIVLAGRAPTTLKKLEVTGLSVDPAARRVELASAKLDGASVVAHRGRDGRIDLQDWYVPGASTSVSDEGMGAPPVSGDKAPAAWTLLVKESEVVALELDYTDASIPRVSKLPRLTLNAKASNLSLDPTQPIPFEAAVALADGSRLSAKGTARPTPLDLDAQMRLQRFTLTHFDPYVAPYVNLSLAAGQLWGNGRLTLVSEPDGGLARIGYDGEISANEFRAIDKVSSQDFLRWSALALPSVKVDWRMKRPGDSLVEIGAVAFVDFYSRIILSPEGKLNLGEILVDPERGDPPRSLTTAPGDGGPGTARVEGIASATPAVEASGPSTEARSRPARIEMLGGEGEPVARPQAAPAKPGTAPRATPPGPRVATLPRKVPAAPAEARPTIRIGTVRIASGNVNFTDLFVRPNYTAQLSQLVGSIEAIASDRETPSDVLVTGRVDDDTPLEITGKINPLAPTSFIDLRAVARGFDLPKLSAYSGRWAGYAIEKGKLTADVRYRIEGDKLQAENRLTINQLTFGEKVDSADAPNLPVRLAVSLLKDRNGNIDLDLPIAGTISDPEFSVGGLMWRAIGNLIVKVVTSPFTLLASLGGASDAELSHIDFTAGNAVLDDEDRRRLDALAKGLSERPALSLEIAGYADPEADRAAMQEDRLEQTLRRAKLAQMKREAPTAELPALQEVRIDDAERPVLLERVWRDAKLDLGSDGKLPPPEKIVEQLNGMSPIATEEVKQFGQQRAQVARDYLRDKRGISNERLYLLAPRIAPKDDPLPHSRANFEIK
jgi:uncharacterized protein involved in outer membrane biogenesis